MASLACTLPSYTCALKNTFLGEDNGLRASINRRTRFSVPNRRLVIECKSREKVVNKLSRVGKKPVEVPSNVDVSLEGQIIKTKGPLGELSLTYPEEIKAEKEPGFLKICKTVTIREPIKCMDYSRTLTDNLVVGVSKGFEKKLQLVGVGYRAALEGNELVMNLGFSHTVRMEIPGELKLNIEESTRITVMGIDKVIIGDFAATIRRWRPPEPYKGKGIRYADEKVRLKEGKAGKKK